MSLMSRLASAQNTASDCAQSMYSVEGARFQEWALTHVTTSNKAELVNSGFIRQLVTDINNKRLTVEQATRQFNNTLFAQFR